MRIRKAEEDRIAKRDIFCTRCKADVRQKIILKTLDPGYSANLNDFIELNPPELAAGDLERN